MRCVMEKAAGTVFVMGVVYWLAFGMALTIVAAIVAAIVGVILVIAMLVSGIHLLVNGGVGSKILGSIMVLLSVGIGVNIVTWASDSVGGEPAVSLKACDPHGTSRTATLEVQGSAQLLGDSVTYGIADEHAHPAMVYVTDKEVTLPYTVSFQFDGPDECLFAQYNEGTDYAARRDKLFSCSITVDGREVDVEDNQEGALAQCGRRNY
jgi:hypothetical protein